MNIAQTVSAKFNLRCELTEATAAEAERAVARAVSQQAEIEPVLSHFESCVAVRLGYILAVTDPIVAGLEQLPTSVPR